MALLAGGGPKKVEKQHREGKLTARERLTHLLDPGAIFLEDRPARCLRQIRRPGAGCGGDHRSGQDRGKAGGRGGERCHRQGGRVVAGDDHQNPARARDRHAKPCADRVPGRFSRRKSAACRTAFFPASTARARIFYYNSLMRRQAARAADRRGHGTLHRRRCLSSRAERLHHHGRKDQFHGPRRAQPGQGRYRRGGGGRVAWRRADAYRRERRGALQGTRRSPLPRPHPATVSRAAAGAGVSGRCTARQIARKLVRDPAGKPSAAL